ncbi:response regulator transcription factor [Clostridium sp. CM028]|uniref:response regulator transcription factor n=1 Tax=unclassified Clostridium TaxID=2614128 RepID=UPI001C0DB74A|nr:MULTISPECIES: response regulator transcription factor [unclassified Clostridium]MBU3092232.1 response regulator transcription factor [Clostridium sp. CF011]MBW9144049.1 response regulator transcription factor [Clostridium sp. CM027]MBW9147640.1 response regulator transcription factor [Clostridium sp. CM028]UVE41299.1 response regulator transcription factor [Clostridium sp. CM027]WAG70297.1 response regulator transcription factor [Clostridium sp. CF011]
MEKINIAIADDEVLIREGLKIILSSNLEINVVGLCGNGEEALKLCRNEKVDVVLMDIRMPLCDGVMGTKLIKSEFKDIKILILTTFKDDEYIYDAMKHGASGYLLKDTSYDIIMDGIKSVYRGNVVMHPEVAAKIINNTKSNSKNTLSNIMDKYKLTLRQVEFIIGIGTGLTNKEIASNLFVTEGTVKNHITEILSKLELRDRTQIAIFALKNSLVDF